MTDKKVSDKKMSDKILIFGGTSDERLVSVASAQNLASQYPFADLWFIQKDGAVSRVTFSELIAHKRPFEQAFAPEQIPFAGNLDQALDLLSGKTVFIGLHGTEGEDGSLQQLFEKNRICFTGSGAAASRLCFEKDRAKAALAGKGILLAPQIRVDFPLAKADLVAKLNLFVNNHGPAVIKPVANGSSIGLEFVDSVDQIDAVAEKLIASKNKNYLVEKFMRGRELTVGVIQVGTELKALPASEVVLQPGSSFDYEGKYLGRGTTEITPAQIPTGVMEQAQGLAISAHRLLGCYGYSRTDMIWADLGMVFLETNTLPGMTKASFFPQQLQVLHCSLHEFLTKQFLLAEQRYADSTFLAARG